jgi:UV DNA damage endonuclease
MRLGFAVKVLGRPELKSHDTRRWQSGPHLSVSLRYLRDILAYLHEAGIRMYRLSSNLAPYLTHPGLPQFHHQLEECEDELAEVGRLASALDVRLSLHPGQYTVLNSTDEDVAHKAIDDVVAQSRILDLMQQGPEAVVVVHAGSGAGGMEKATARFVRRFHQLPPKARRRLVVENDESVFSVPDVLRIHQATGLPVVFDLLHFNNNNPDRRSAIDALRAALDTWPPEVTAKIHVSSPRTEMRVAQKKDPATGRKVRTVTPPRWSHHSDYANPFEVIGFLQEALQAGVRPFDVMLELKSKDLGLLQLRQDLQRFAPELVGKWF